MRRIATVCLASLLVPAAVWADAPTPVRGGGDFAIVLPFGDWGRTAHYGLGVFVRGEYRATPRLAVTARAGFVDHMTATRDTDLGTVTTTTSELAALLGTRVLLRRDAGPYLGLEVGVVKLSTDISDLHGDSTESDVKLGGTIGAGWRSGGLDASVRFFTPSITNVRSVPGVMLSVGYDVGL